MPGVIITGGTKGIGRSLVIKFAEEGFDIVTCSRNLDHLNDLHLFINQKFPDVKINLLQCDASKKSEVQNFGEKALDILGIPDVLINNVGIFRRVFRK